MKGKVDISKLSSPPEKHEINVANLFSDLGYDVTFIKASNIPDIHTPDILMDGVEWEIKSPLGKGKHTIERNIKNALLQSNNIIFDLRRINIPEDKCISRLKNEFKIRKEIHRLYIIKMNSDMILLTRK